MAPARPDRHPADEPAPPLAAGTSVSGAPLENTMSRLKFEKFKQLVGSLYHPQLDSWPSALPPECLALLQHHVPAGIASDEALLMQRAIESSIANQELASIHEKYLSQPLAWVAGIDPETQLVPVLRPAISAKDFAFWLAKQGEKPSEVMAVWFAALGAKAQPVVSAAIPMAEPVAEAVPNLLRERNQRWADHYRLEKQVRVTGAFTRAAKHFDVEPSKLRKAVQKVLADGHEPADVNDSPGSIFGQLIRTGKR
jgi:hypothetical protein